MLELHRNINDQKVGGDPQRAVVHGFSYDVDTPSPAGGADGKRTPILSDGSDDDKQQGEEGEKGEESEEGEEEGDGEEDGEQEEEEEVDGEAPDSTASASTRAPALKADTPAQPPVMPPMPAGMVPPGFGFGGPMSMFMPPMQPMSAEWQQYQMNMMAQQQQMWQLQQQQQQQQQASSGGAGPSSAGAASSSAKEPYSEPEPDGEDGDEMCGCGLSIQCNGTAIRCDWAGNVRLIP